MGILANGAHLSCSSYLWQFVREMFLIFIIFKQEALRTQGG
jgi:hypothetical protein